MTDSKAEDQTNNAAESVDLRVLALLDGKLLPKAVMEPFDHWRIWRSREAVVKTVRKRHLDDFMLNLLVERLEAAEDESGIFEGIYAIAQIVELHRKRLGMHGQYIVMVMAGQINPWGLVALNQDLANPTPSTVDAARELWRLIVEHEVNVIPLFTKVRNDPTFQRLTAFYKSQRANVSPNKNPTA